MKKHIIVCIVLTICVAVWPRSAEDRKVLGEMVELAVTTEIEAPKADITTITDKKEPTLSSMLEGGHMNL